MSAPQPFGSHVGFHLIAAELLPLCFTLEDSFQLHGMSWIVWDVDNQDFYEKRDLYRCSIVAAHECDILDRSIPFGNLHERVSTQVFFSAQDFHQILAFQPIQKDLSALPCKEARVFLTSIEGDEPSVGPVGSIEVAVPFMSFRKVTDRARYGAARHGKRVVTLHPSLLYIKAALLTLEQCIEHESDLIRRQAFVHHHERLQQMRNIRSEWMHQHKQYVGIASYSKDTYIVHVGIHPSIYQEAA